MEFIGEDADRFAAIHRLLRTHQLTVMPGPFYSQADIEKSYEQTAELMTSTIPHRKPMDERRSGHGGRETPIWKVPSPISTIG